jgi:hypothetical protein
LIIENITGHDGTEQLSESGGDTQKRKIIKNGRNEANEAEVAQTPTP